VRISSIYRSVLPWHPATAWALTASTIVLVGAGVSHGIDAGTRGALTVFLAWAIVRELAPRRFLASALAPFAAVAFAIPANTDVLSCVGVLLAARIAARSTGAAPTLLDCLLLVPLAAWLATRPEGLPVALVLAAVTFIDEPVARVRGAGVAMLVAALLVGSTEGTLTVRFAWEDGYALGTQLLFALLAASSILLVAWPLPRRLRVRDDRDRAHLRGTRIRAARVVVVAALLAQLAWTGSDGVLALSAACAAIVAAAIGGAGARSARGVDDPARSGTLSA
jgi:hypothetical protein